MSEEEKSKSSGMFALLSFLVGTAVGVGIVLLVERKKQDDIEAGYDEGPLFV
jgi:hypothetical protein